MTNHLANSSKASHKNRVFRDVAEENLPVVELDGNSRGRTATSAVVTRSATAGQPLAVARFPSLIFASFLSVMAGCGIPPLRGPQPGPVLPETFVRATTTAALATPPPAPAPTPNSDNKSQPEDGGTKSEDNGTTNPDGEKTSNAKKDRGSIQLTSYHAPAKWTADPETDSFEGESVGSEIDLAQPDAKAGDSDKERNGPDAAKASGSDSDKKTPDAEAGGLYGDMTKADEDATDPDVIANSPDNSSHLTWYEFFNDPTLVGLIEQALAGNQELKILTEEIFIANNEIQARRGEYLPFVTLGGRAELEKSSRFTRDGAVEEELEVAEGEPFTDPLPDFLAAADLTWEVDIWRKLRNARDAAVFRYLATQDGQQYIVTRLVAEVAENYYELLALDNRLRILDQTIAIQQQSLEVAEALKAAGRATELGVQRFTAEVRKNQSEKLVIQQEIIQTENRINFLLGRYPQTVERPPVEFIDLALPTLKVGVPVQLLQNRPDVRQAERDLAAAGLEIEVARARFYPSLSITGALGLRSQDWNPKYFFQTPESLVYNIAGELVAPLINKQAIKAQYKTANAKQLQALYHYQKTVLNAYTEVVNRMSKVENYGQSIEVKRRQLAALEASVDAAVQLFQNARVDYVDVLLAQREMMEARMILINTKQQQLSAVISTYQALGGGSLPPGPGNSFNPNCPPVPPTSN